ncbi:hypothetical protein [Methanobrevibacter sp.]|uniref:hypothetical protein n=1 Tax=Methanobrevibacter sp. TaxID=66852 RepID=UPI0025F6620E|nr:hypothetical protein [Methanobrevibacter sp.]MBQ2832379.1 hypothetical protein [Methanobrevibacter sp.]
MTENRFIFNSFVIEHMLGDKELKLYEIDNNPSDDLDESNLFYVYSTSDENIKSIVNKLNELTEEIGQLKQDALYWGQNAEARRKEIDRLRKDNDILKKQRDYLFEVIDSVLPHSGSTTAYNRMKNIGDVE